MTWRDTFFDTIQKIKTQFEWLDLYYVGEPLSDDMLIWEGGRYELRSCTNKKLDRWFRFTFHPTPREDGSCTMVLKATAHIPQDHVSFEDEAKLRKLAKIPQVAEFFRRSPIEEVVIPKEGFLPQHFGIHPNIYVALIDSPHQLPPLHLFKDRLLERYPESAPVTSLLCQREKGIYHTYYQVRFLEETFILWKGDITNNVSLDRDDRDRTPWQLEHFSDMLPSWPQSVSLPSALDPEDGRYVHSDFSARKQWAVIGINKPSTRKVRSRY